MTGVLKRLIPCLKYMELPSLLSTLGQFGPVLLPLVSKNGDEERCFLK